MQLEENYVKKEWAKRPQKPNVLSDVRGYDAFDSDGEHVGIVSEVYCHAETLSAEYIEIIPVDESSENTSWLYPFDSISWQLGYKVTLNSKKKDLINTHSSNMQGNYQEQFGLVTYDEALDKELMGVYDYELYCA